MSSLFETLPVQLHFLPDDVHIEDVVRRTRHAASAFLSSASLGWTRTKLRSWLIVEYGMATEWTREDEVAPWLHPVARMDDEHVQATVEEVRKRVTRMIVEASTAWSAPGFAKEMIDQGLITCVTDASDREAYAPAARVDLGLLERVASLFIADYLMHPADYAEIVWCECCGEMLINGRVRHGKGCVRQSAVRPAADAVRPPAESGVTLSEAIATTVRPRGAFSLSMKRAAER
jgi:hypothetical protein